MKTNCWLVLGTMLATTAVAQIKTNMLPEIPAPATVATPVASTQLLASTNTPALIKKKVVVKKKAVKKISEPTVALVAGPATVMSEHLNVRGQAGLKGEAISHLKKGDAVTVVSQINLDKHAADEPAQWAKILLPAGVKVWVDSKFVDTTNKVVAVKKLNLRAGPGENFSVLGVLEKGAPISEVSVKGDWTQIEAPTNAYAFVAAIYLKQEVAPVVIAPPPPTPIETPVIAPTPATTNTVSEAPPIVPTPVVTPSPVTPAVVPPVADTNPPPRVVSHEGYVRSSVSPVAPTDYELYDAENGNAINYLYTTATNLNLARYNGYQIVVTGEEGLTARWNATPVLTIKKIYVLSTNPPTLQRATSPRASQRH